MTELISRLEVSPVVPLVEADDPDVAIATTRALAEGGLTVIEVVLRTPAALDCLQAICELDDDLVVGAGTVLDGSQAAEVLNRGASFIVSPGLDEESVKIAQSNDAPILPGVYTPSEVIRARNMGVDVVKFFPASIAGGIPALKAMSSVFQTMKFMPTGGVSPGNLNEFPFAAGSAGMWRQLADAKRRYRRWRLSESDGSRGRSRGYRTQDEAISDYIKSVIDSSVSARFAARRNCGSFPVLIWYAVPGVAVACDKVDAPERRVFFDR